MSLHNKSSSEKVDTCKLCLICPFFSPDSDKMTFSLQEAILWKKDLYFSWKQWFEVKNVFMNF